MHETRKEKTTGLQEKEGRKMGHTKKNKGT
jgi:hypothetical protein